ncbi:MAG: hypothetical protein ACMXX6_00730 [Candidatus Woesearchaeota archaeon]
MTLDDYLFEDAKRVALKKFNEDITDFKTRLENLEGTNYADKHHIYEEAKRLVDLIKKTKFDKYLGAEYNKIYEAAGFEETKKFVENKGVFSLKYWFDLKYKVARSYLKNTN